jgi:hypothetical protein
MGSVAFFYRTQKHLHSILKNAAFILLILTGACSKKGNEIAEKINQSEKIRIIHIGNNSSDTTIVAATEILKAFSDLVKNEEIDCDCEKNGELIFYKNDSAMLKFDFSTKLVSEKNDCEYLIYKQGIEKKCFRLTYRTGMFLGNN